MQGFQKKVMKKMKPSDSDCDGDNPKVLSVREKEKSSKDSYKREGHRQRLRQRFLNGGLKGFHDYEVVELLLTLNTPRRDCKEPAKSLMKKFKTLQGVLEADPLDISKVRGIGMVNSMGLSLIKAVADRYLEKKIFVGDKINNTQKLLDYLKHRIGFKGKEVFLCLFLDAKNHVLASETLFEGSLTTSFVYPREVIARAIQHQAASLIVAHNHPSGDIQPSANDIWITRRLLFALNYVDIKLHEHLIVGGGNHYSFATEGLIAKFNEDFYKNNE